MKLRKMENSIQFQSVFHYKFSIDYFFLGKWKSQSNFNRFSTINFQSIIFSRRNFLISLAAFPKTLVCGLQGHTSGIAVSMLPLFDLVFADSSASFSLPNAKIGSNVEGISILRFSGKVKINSVSNFKAILIV